MRITSIVGARPQFVKLAPIDAAAQARGHDHTIVHTGQHYDPDMSASFFDTLEIPQPDVNLQVGSGRHGAQTGQMLAELERVLDETRPDWVVVYGDTNSTVAAALAAAKIHLPIAHVEAGLRSFNRAMPEEHNRVLTDHAADLLLAPTRLAMDHLDNEGLSARAVLVGDVMVDVFRRVQAEVGLVDLELPLDTSQPFHLATIHRQENTDDPERLDATLDALASLGETVLLAAHPRLRDRAEQIGVSLERSTLVPTTPLSYPTLVATLGRCESVITDSGGLQKEAFLAGRRCTTMRTETEWPETLADGWNVLVDDPARLTEAVSRPTPVAVAGHPYGQGDAADKVIAAIAQFDPVAVCEAVRR